MKLGIIGCLAGSAAALLFSGCTSDEVAAVDSYRSPYYTSVGTTAPVFVERRTVMVDNVARDVPIYRTGDAYFYTWGGRRFTLTDYPEFRRTTGTRVITSRPASARYRSVDRTIIRRDDDLGDREMLDERVRMREMDDLGETSRMTERRVQIRD